MSELLMNHRKVYELCDGVDTSMGFAIVGTAAKFSARKHAGRCYLLAREYGLRIYPVVVPSADEVILTEEEESSMDKRSVCASEQMSRHAQRKTAFPQTVLTRKTYGTLAELQGKVDIIIPCLMPRHIPDIVSQSSAAGAHTIWFQEKNWTAEFQEQADNIGLTVIQGCFLKHRPFQGMGKYLHPCYWHGRQEEKLRRSYRTLR